MTWACSSKTGTACRRTYAQAMVWYRKADAAGDVNSARSGSVVCLLPTGHGITQDYAQAMAWYRKSAADGRFIPGADATSHTST